MKLRTPDLKKKRGPFKNEEEEEEKNINKKPVRILTCELYKNKSCFELVCFVN